MSSTPSTATRGSFSALHRGQGPAGRPLRPRHPRRDRLVSVPSIAGRVLRAGQEAQGRHPRVSVPSIAGRVLRGDIEGALAMSVLTRFSALHRGQGPAGGVLGGERVEALGCFSALHRGQGPAGTSGATSGGSKPAASPFQCPPSRAGSCGRRPTATSFGYSVASSFSALHRGQGPAGCRVPTSR